MPKCTECKFCYIVDNGYSNYTVLDSTIHCLQNLNPDFPVNDSGWYWDEQSLNHPINLFAEKCGGFTPGTPLHMDVDMNDEPEILKIVNADPDLLAAWTKYGEK